MLPRDVLLGQLLRGRSLLAVILWIIPFAALALVGVLWLYEKGLMVQFILGTGVIMLLARLLPPLLARRPRKGAGTGATTGQEPAGAPLLAVNPDWNDSEQALFRTLSAHVQTRVSAGLAWEDMQTEAFDLLERAARGLSGGRRQALDFSAPEALLLAERVVTGLRRDIRDYVPFADTVSLRSLWWLWSHREGLATGGTWISWAWRAQRMARNPLVGVTQEIQNLTLSGTTETMRQQGESTIQRMILEEVLRAAIDLHSGRLRYSEAELRQIQLASDSLDAAHAALPDQDLRLVVTGQVSAGKTSLINALGSPIAGETDMTPTTPDLVAQPMTIAGMDFSVVDTPGIDGSPQVQAQILDQLLQADMILWVVRANRPARAADLALLQALRARVAADPRRRMPPVIAALSATDRLFPEWPWPEHYLPPDALTRLREVIAAIEGELGLRIVLPVSTMEPAWNIEELGTLVAQNAPEGFMVQRNRRRIEAETREGRIGHELSRARRGALQAASTAWKLWRGEGGSR